jgi:hypothetical protein
MAELAGEGKAEIIPSSGLAGPMVQGDMGRYVVRVNDFTASGTKDQFSIAVPDTAEWSLRMLRVAILKSNSWKAYPIPTILHADLYAERMGLDIMAGDVYMAGERLATTAGAKIRHAMASGKIAGYTVDITEGPNKAFEYMSGGKKETVTLPNYKAKVTVEVVGWKNPMVYEATLAEWFEGRNPNWRTRTTYMLRRNALSKALEEVAPMGVEADEAPPATIESSMTYPQTQAYQNQAASQKASVGIGGLGMLPTFGTATKGLLGGDNE